MISTPDHISKLSPYKPGISAVEVRSLSGRSNILKLSSNENPIGTSPKAMEAITVELTSSNIYPDGGLELRCALADHFATAVSNIICHSGSDALLHLIMRTFVGAGDELLSSEGTFIGFYVAAALTGNPVRLTPLTKDFRFDVQRLVDSITPTTKVVYLANANNPTGTVVSRDEFEYLLNNLPDTTLLISDQAYHEYSADLLGETYPDAATYNRPNIITLRTFSKAYGLAGVRVGYAIADSAVIEPMLRSKLPFDPSVLASVAGIAALGDAEFLRQTLAENRLCLQALSGLLTRLGVEFYGSAANFVMMRFSTPSDALKVYDGLIKLGVATRPLNGFGLDSCVRVNTCRMEDFAVLEQALVQAVTAPPIGKFD